MLYKSDLLTVTSNSTLRFLPTQLVNHRLNNRTTQVVVQFGWRPCQLEVGEVASGNIFGYTQMLSRIHLLSVPNQLS